ncbi:MAG: HAD family hydrolase [Chloroflexi bacterium]|nr:HAD family hydrolase [Chloroflexota bacterium]
MSNDRHPVPTHHPSPITHHSSLWLRPDFAPARPLDTVVFDVDGVLIDVRGSYRRVVREVAAFAVEHLYGLRPSEPLVSDEDVGAFKRAGGFNDDWDLAYALTALSLARLRGRLGAAPLADLVARSGGRGLDWLHDVVGAEDRPDYMTIHRIFDELYWGADLLCERLGLTPQYAPGAPGLLRTERPLLAPGTLDELAARGVAKLGLLTGRVRVEMAMALEILGFHDPATVPFQAIVTAEDGRKPDPATLARIVASLRPRAGLYVGDTADDLALVQRYSATPAAALAPFYAVLVAEGAERAHYQAAGAHAVVQGVADLPALLDALRARTT